MFYVFKTDCTIALVVFNKIEFHLLIEGNKPRLRIWINKG